MHLVLCFIRTFTDFSWFGSHFYELWNVIWLHPELTKQLWYQSTAQTIRSRTIPHLYHSTRFVKYLRNALIFCDLAAIFINFRGYLRLHLEPIRQKWYPSTAQALGSRTTPLSDHSTHIWQIHTHNNDLGANFFVLGFLGRRDPKRLHFPAIVRYDPPTWVFWKVLQRGTVTYILILNFLLKG